jgi:hypothetical protein
MNMSPSRRRFLKLASAVAAWPATGSAREASAVPPRTYLSRAEAAKLSAQIATVPLATRREFARRYAAWRKTWARGDLAFSSDTAAYRKSKEFSALVALGPPIRPLLIQRIARPDEFFALQAYEVIELGQPEGVSAAGTGSGERAFESEQAKAKRVVQDWFAR